MGRPSTAQHPLRKWREKLGYDQEMLVMLIQHFDPAITIRPDYIGTIERGIRRPSYNLAKAISKVTNGKISVVDLLEFPIKPKASSALNRAA